MSVGARTEWDLLVIASDIEPGDVLWVEDENGNETQMSFVKEKDGKTIILKDENKNLLLFSAVTLESADGYGYITGKVDTDD